MTGFGPVSTRFAFPKGGSFSQAPQQPLPNGLALLQPGLWSLHYGAFSIRQQIAKSIGRKIHCIDRFAAQLQPLGVSRKDEAIRKGERLSPKDTVEPIH